MGKPPEESPGSVVWRSYSVAYKLKYGEFPPRNAKINALLKQLLQRIPIADAAPVAEYFLSVDEPTYRKAMHPVDLLLRDCEKLHTLWRTKAKSNGHALGSNGHDYAVQSKPWWEVWSGIEKMGEQLGIVAHNEPPPVYKAKVYQMAALVGELPEHVALKLGVKPD